MKISIYAIPGLNIQTHEKIIEEAVCSVFATTSEKLRAATRKREVVEPRMMTMYFFQQYTSFGVISIGKKLGGFHHATVLHGIKTVKILKIVDKEFARKFDAINEKIKGCIK